MPLGVNTINGLRQLVMPDTAANGNIVPQWKAGHLDIVFGRELEIALNASAGMFRSLAFIAVRQQHHQALRASPTCLRRHNKLIDETVRR